MNNSKINIYTWCVYIGHPEKKKGFFRTSNIITMYGRKCTFNFTIPLQESFLHEIEHYVHPFIIIQVKNEQFASIN